MTAHAPSYPPLAVDIPRGRRGPTTGVFSAIASLRKAVEEASERRRSSVPPTPVPPPDVTNQEEEDHAHADRSCG